MRAQVKKRCPTRLRMATYRLKEYVQLKLRDGVLVQGLPGIGLVGKLAVDYIVREMQLPKVADLYVDSLLMQSNVVTLVDESAILRLLSYEFYLHRGPRDVLFLTAPAQPVVWAQYEVAEYVLNYFQMLEGREVVAVCGTTMGKEGEDAVYFAAANHDVRKELSELGFKPSSGGVITGACGLIPALASLRGLRAYTLMSFAYSVEPDPAAAKRIVQALCRLFGLSVDTRNLDALIEEVRKMGELEKKLSEEVARRERGPLPPFYV